MARIRSVHPSMFTDEAVVSCSPLARYLYVGLWTDADDQGLFEWKPLQLKMRLLPGDSAETAPLLAELVNAKLIASFEYAGKRLGAIKYFRRFQRPKKPTATFPLPPEWRAYVGLEGEEGEPPDDDDPLGHPSDGHDADVVPHSTHLNAPQFPTASELSPQMEDGGCRREEDGEPIGSLVAAGDETPAFEDVWRAYPHVKGRSSKPKATAVWAKLSHGRRLAMLRAVQRYAKEGREPREDCGAPAFDKWLRDQRYLDWMEAEPAGPRWQGPPSLRSAVVARCGEEFARSFLDACAWQDVPTPALIPRTAIAAERLQRDAGDVLRAAGVGIARRVAA